MKLYVINLDRRPDRLEYFTEQTSRLNIAFERISAVDGRTVEFDEQAKAIGTGPILGHEIGPFALACFESHRKAWKALLDSGDPCAMVMEDDLVFADDFGELMEGAWVPADADLVRLETYLDLRGKFDRTAATKAGKRGVYRMRSSMLGAGAYLITAAAARRLWDASRQISDPVDAFLFHQNSPLFGSTVIYQMIPAPSIQGVWLHGVQQAGWSSSSLIMERVEIAERHTPAESELRRSIRHFVLQPLWKLKARLSGLQHLQVPFG